MARNASVFSAAGSREKLRSRVRNNVEQAAGEKIVREPKQVAQRGIALDVKLAAHGVGNVTERSGLLHELPNPDAGAVESVVDAVAQPEDDGLIGELGRKLLTRSDHPRPLSNRRAPKSSHDRSLPPDESMAKDKTTPRVAAGRRGRDTRVHPRQPAAELLSAPCVDLKRPIG